MLAYVYDESGTLGLKDMPKPQEKDDNAIIKVAAASICGTDFRAFMHGSSKITPPRILGHEVAGEIVYAGPKVRAKGFNEGARVTMAPAIGCGHCWPCSTGHSNMCDNLQTIGFQFEGSFAEYLEIPYLAFEQGNVVDVPYNVSYEEAPLAEPIACALNAQEYLKPKSGDYMVIYGSGFIGCMHAELAFHAGARDVIMVEIAQNRAEAAKRLVPGIQLLNPNETDTVEAVREITHGRGANVVVTACSVPAVHTEAQIIASKMGRISLFGGLPGDGKGFIDSNLIHYKELCVYGVHATSPRQVQTVLNWMSEGALDAKKYISNVFPLSEIEKGFIAIRDENIMKAVVKP